MMDEADPKGNPIGTELVFDWRMRAIARAPQRGRSA